MQFLIDGAAVSDIQAALVERKHVCHAISELAADMENKGGDSAAGDPSVLLPMLEKKQWNLVTTDKDFTQAVYDQKVPFHGVIVLILAESAESQASEKPIERLFERYKRLTPGRLYTVTPGRVKIRQLPGSRED